MNRQELFHQIQKKKSFLCIGLDSDIHKIPKHLLKLPDPVLAFNKQIIEATHDLCVGYKPNIAFYESEGAKGWQCLEKTLDLIPQNIFKIADAKRGDIGNTSAMYAKTFFERMSFDAITVSPYMGHDSVIPYLKHKDKWAILLALTSNPGAMDFQFLRTNHQNKMLYEKVLIRSKSWGNTDNMMYVVGATRAEMLSEVRKIVPDHFLLIPGVGEQGGSLEDVARFGLNDVCGLLVNASRSIIYAGKGVDFAEKARAEAMKLQGEMEMILLEKGLI